MGPPPMHEPPIIPAQAVVGRGQLAQWAINLAPPWIAAGLACPAAIAAHTAWGDAPTWPAVGLALGTTAIGALTWRAGNPRGPLIRLHATATVAAAGGWLTLAT